MKDLLKRIKLFFMVLSLLRAVLLLGEENAQVKKRKFTQEELIKLDQSHDLAKKYMEDSDYQSVDFELNKLYQIAPEGYKESEMIRNQLINAYKKKKGDDEQRKREEENRLKKK